MAGNISPAAQLKLATLQDMAERVQHVHGLVERFASTRDPKQAEALTQPMKRAFAQLKLHLMGAGLDSMSQLAGGMEIAAGRGGASHSKGRILREGVGSLRSQLDQEQRKVMTDEKVRQATEDAEKRAAES